jgi:hypothetical protein
MTRAYSLSTAVALFFLAASASAQNVSVGQSAPNFELSQFGGGTLSLANFQDSVVFIYFFGYN